MLIECFVEVVKFLLEFGEECKTLKAVTWALSAARKNGYDEIVALLEPVLAQMQMNEQ